MKTKFKFIGLERVNKSEVVATCEPLTKEETFKAKLKLTVNEQKDLWEYCKNMWADKKIAIIEHDGLNDEIPVNPVLLYFEE